MSDTWAALGGVTAAWRKDHWYATVPRGSDAWWCTTCRVPIGSTAVSEGQYVSAAIALMRAHEVAVRGPEPQQMPLFEVPA